MKFRFNREVRKSSADELKKVSTFVGMGLGVLGYSINAPLILLSAFFVVDCLSNYRDVASCDGG